MEKLTLKEIKAKYYPYEDTPKTSYAAAFSTVQNQYYEGIALGKPFIVIYTIQREGYMSVTHAYFDEHGLPADPEIFDE